MKKIFAALGVVLVALGLAVAIAAPAQAAYSDCPAGQGCVWTGHYGTGSRLNLPVGTYAPHQCWTLNVSWGNVISSAKATYGSGLALYLFTSSSCNGSLPWYAFANDQVDFPTAGPINDKVKSFIIGN